LTVEIKILVYYLLLELSLPSQIKSKRKKKYLELMKIIFDFSDSKYLDSKDKD